MEPLHTPTLLLLITLYISTKVSPEATAKYFPAPVVSGRIYQLQFILITMLIFPTKYLFILCESVNVTCTIQVIQYISKK